MLQFKMNLEKLNSKTYFLIDSFHSQRQVEVQVRVELRKLLDFRAIEKYIKV
jgi:hypothetical protein